MYFKEEERLEVLYLDEQLVYLVVVHSAVAQLKQKLTIQPCSRHVHHALSYDWSICNFFITMK